MSLRWPITSEREIRAGPISDVPQICNNSCASVVDGRQPFLPVGFPAVSSGFQGGWDCSQSGAVAAGSSRLACRAAWERAALEVRAARITAALPVCSRGGFLPLPRTSRNALAMSWARLNAVRQAPAASSRGFSPFHPVCTWATVMLSRAATTRHWLNLRRVGSGRDCAVRASGSWA